MKYTVPGYLFVLVASLGLVACGGYGGGGSYVSINGYVAGSWEFTSA